MLVLLLNKYKVQIVIVVALLAVGVYAGYQWFSPDPPVIQTYAPEVKQGDGSIIVVKTPDASVKPSATIPKGSTLTRVIKVAVKAKLPTVSIEGAVSIETKVQQLADMVKQSAPPEMVEQAKQEVIAACVQQECGPVTVNIDLITDQEGQQRAVV